MSPGTGRRRDWSTFLPALTTPTLTLREPQASDAVPLCRHLATDEVGRLMMPPPPTPQGFQQFFGWVRRQRAAGRCFCYVIQPAGEREPVGLIQARAIEPGYGIAEWGFCVGRSYWGTGLFVDAARLLADFLFRQVGVRRLEARVVLPNVRAAGALRKLGADPEGILRSGLEVHGTRLDQTLWALDGNEWLTRVAQPIGTIGAGQVPEDVPDAGETGQPSSEWARNPPILTAAGCSLRELVPDDAPLLSELLSTPSVARFLAPPPNGVPGFEQFIRWTQQQRYAGRSVALGVVPAGMERAVGFFQLHSVAPKFATAEWGFALGERYWGSGLFGTGADLMLRFVFDTINVRRLEARAAVDNHRATGALRKVGATPECRLRRSFLLNDQCHDDLLWSLLDDEWRAGEARRVQAAETSAIVAGAGDQVEDAALASAQSATTRR